MYTLSLKSGKPIAVDTSKECFIRLTEKNTFADTGRTSDEHIQKTHDLMPLPAIDGLDRILVVGASGCGKTTFIARYLKIYFKYKAKKPVVVFSDCEPETLHQLNEFNPLFVKLDSKLVSNPIQTSELANSIVIFDDIDSISTKDIRIAVKTLASSIFKKGSTKNNIDVLMTYHAINSGMDTRDAILNSNAIVFFTSSPMGIPFALQKLGFNKKQIEKCTRLNSRYVYLKKDAPNYIVYETGVYFPHQLE